MAASERCLLNLMKLQTYQSRWACPGSVAAAQARGFDGIEAQAPADSAERREWHKSIVDAGLDYIAEICTMGNYIPPPHASPQAHLDSFRMQVEAALECSPRFITTLAGSDAWELGEAVDFLGRLLAVGRELGVLVSVETHRSRCTFSPWATRLLLQQLPELRLTCDFSHWCCVCERLVLDEEPELLALCASRAHHIHARVGYDQGPQVPHPAAPEYAGVLIAHERWWRAIWHAQQAAGFTLTTMTPEFGPDGYLHTTPFTARPVADLIEINVWMARRQRRHFDDHFVPQAA